MATWRSLGKWVRLYLALRLLGVKARWRSGEVAIPIDLYGYYGSPGVAWLWPLVGEENSTVEMARQLFRYIAPEPIRVKRRTEPVPCERG